MPDAEQPLETVTLTGVEIFSSGGPYFGTKSPPEGDFYTAEQIDEIVSNTRRLQEQGELFPANKIGHSKEQALAVNSGYVTEGEKPALGWLTNFQAVDRDGQRKIVCDIEAVPKKFAALIEARAYRTRSVELSKMREQNGDTVERFQAVTGLAWLGAKAPAVRTLADVHDLFAEGDVIWNPEEGMQATCRQVQEALNPGPGMDETRYWVSDVTADQALVNDWKGGYTYVVPFTREGGKITPAPAADWKLAEQAWVEAAADYAAKNVSVVIPGSVVNEAELIAAFSAAGLRKNAATPADTGEQMAGEQKPTEYSDEQIAAFATGFGIDEADAAKRRELVTAKFDEITTPEEKPKEDPATPPEDPAGTPAAASDPAPANGAVQMTAAEYEVLRTKAERGDKAAERFFARERETEVDQRIKQGRIAPARRDFWLEEAKTEFESTGDITRTVGLMDEMPIQQELIGVYGVDDDGLSPQSRAEADDRDFAAYANATNLKVGAAS